MDTNDSIPPTEPVSATIAPKRGRPKGSKNKVETQQGAPRAALAGNAFVPDLASRALEVSQSYVFWVGAKPAMPTESCDIAGVNFPKLNVIKRTKNGKQDEFPVIGSLVRLTRPQVEEIASRMSRTIIRFNGPKQDRQPGAETAEAGVERPYRKGQLITIPTAEELETRRKNQFAAIPYEQGPFDEPVADYLFAQLCEDQDQPTRGSVYPDPLSVTGLSWPE